MNNINIFKNKLHPCWVTGFVYAEGCFTVAFSEDNKCKTGWQIRPAFKIKLHKRDEKLIKRIKSFFKEAGSITVDERFVYYNVCKLKEITAIIIPYFSKYPLITQKQSDFFLWKGIIELISNSEHLNMNGLIKILTLRASLNKGLSNKLKLSFPMLTLIKRPKVCLPVPIDYNWFAGFFSGEGCFFIEISKTNYVNLRILVGQHSRDKLLIGNLINTLNCGSVKTSGNLVTFSVNNFENIYNKILPLFKKYPIEGAKSLDFEDFCEAVELIYNKAHFTFTNEGLNQIRKIKSRMNLSIGKC